MRADLIIAVAALAASLAAQDPTPAIRIEEAPCTPRALAPRLTARGDTLVLSWLDVHGDGEHRSHVLRCARWVDAGGERAGWDVDGAAIVRGDRMFANWADTPRVTLGANRAIAHWLFYPQGERSGYGYHAGTAISTDGGSTWRALGRLHDDESRTQHGFVSFAPTANGFDAVWLDGRLSVRS